MTMNVTVDGKPVQARSNETVLELLNRVGTKIPQVCYHPQLGPLQTCDTCMVEANGKLVRACGVAAAAGMQIATKPPHVAAAQRQAFDRILADHLLYCTVCDNNNGNCTVHDTTKLLGIEHQELSFRPKPYEIDATNPF